MLDTILKDFGFISRKGKGSHIVYKHKLEENPIAVAAHKAHIPVYIIKQVLEAIDRIREREDEEYDNDENS